MSAHGSHGARHSLTADHPKAVLGAIRDDCELSDVGLIPTDIVMSGPVVE